jgi:hypothetical protein
MSINSTKVGSIKDLIAPHHNQRMESNHNCCQKTLVNPRNPGRIAPDSQNRNIKKLSKTRTLDVIYPILNFDCLFVKSSQEEPIRNKAIYLALGINLKCEKSCWACEWRKQGACLILKC